MTTTENIRKELQDLVDSKYQEFHSALVPGIGIFLVYVFRNYEYWLKKSQREITGVCLWKQPILSFMKRRMLQGMVIGLAKMELDERMKHISMFVPRIDNWAVCDIFCGELKTAVKKGKETVWQFIQPYLISPKEFEIRFGIVMLFHYVDEEHIDALLHTQTLSATMLIMHVWLWPG